MNDERVKRIAKAALLGIILGAAACDEPAKSAVDAKDGGKTAQPDSDRSGMGDKAHCS
ncbi:MAG TPA: hypothetical protein VGH28_27670 [Polyangiaceae bacterium]|jgi:hypothetical protein